MIRRFLIVSLLLLSFLTLLYYVSSYQQELQAEGLDKYLESQAKEIVDTMSPEELTGQVIHVTIPGKTLDETAEKEIEEILPGGIILFGTNIGTKEEISKLNLELQKKSLEVSKLPLLISVDQEGGRVLRVRDGVTQFPGAMALGQTKNADYAYKVGFVTSYQLRKLGFNFVFAPDLDINNNPDNPVINTRSMGSTPEMVSASGIGYEKGARIGGAVPTIKHFPGHGDTNVDSHLGLPKIDKTLEELEKMELIPFQESIRQGAEVVMSAHILYPKLDPDFPATLSSKILTGILRDKMGFQGVIITDAMEMNAIDAHYKDRDPGVLAILAGADILLMTSWGKTTRNMKNQILTAYKRGTFQKGEKDLLKEAVYRQILLKLKHGIVYEFSSKKFESKEKLSDLEQKEIAFFQNQIAEREKNFLEIFSPTLNSEISRASIVTFPSSFNPIAVKTEETIFSVREKEFGAVLAEKNIQNTNPGKIPSLVKSNKFKRIVTTTFSQLELDLVAGMAKRYPETEIVDLHYGTPFLKLNTLPNLKILFSFSPTSESKRALLYSVLERTSPIPVVDLILKGPIVSKQP
ncbi:MULTISPECIES: glycoside hydrolase family 3 protein [unclassified Leptospira]|uniref:glycoside hydrolase family 3 protein n=1 Tax=unclassified Leptospira TaxID=2633828 RepID=UPI000292862E|nr:MULTISPECIES: glycoside hydrolase family 3 protein [unclassified Leptospira]EKO77907.1 glycosyl hydrolase family 3, N-terminal domain protein [Leptospira sp. Fiocruz LV3954]EMI65002.1 glycosyl hydrolase family 3, N-terminal domain protein [Leptospira sp. Fiocruz LV4135]